ncbi:unnamed protein product [Arabidopsis arenosa]|uniref:WW domain-containing protein n=1 Tax=Arabidopsis arenosa TaxID=38785 RepID=A0A8S2A7F8_ARAAE|nr:unnamed protein product [Arabidopsis arenosa]
MEGSATKGPELWFDIGKLRFPRSVRYAMRSATKDLELRNSYADIEKSRHSIVSRIYVEGYDTSLSGHDFVYAMRAHFASCGEVMLVYIPGYVCGGGRSIGNRFAFVYLRGEGAEERALKLHGSYMGGHKLVVEPYPFHATYLDHKLAPMREADNKQQYTFFVEGYDTSLPLDYVKFKLYEHFSKCGSIRFIISVTQKEHGGPLSSSAKTSVDGIDLIEKVLQLGRCDVKRLENIYITRVAPPEPDEAFLPCIHPAHLWTCSSSKTPSAMAAAATAPEDPNLPEPPCMSTLLPYPYNLRFQNLDVESKKLFYASQPAVKRYAPEDPSLPEPWKRLESSNTYSYYWNTETNVTQYERPPSSS